MNKLKRYLLPALLVMASATSHAQSQSAPLELESLKNHRDTGNQPAIADRIVADTSGQQSPVCAQQPIADV